MPTKICCVETMKPNIAPEQKHAAKSVNIIKEGDARLLKTIRKPSMITASLNGRRYSKTSKRFGQPATLPR